MLVREPEAIDLGRFQEVHSVYTYVIHGVYTANAGTAELEKINRTSGNHPKPVRIIAYGLAAVGIGPWAFSARPIDFGPTFILGCLLGFLELVVVARSPEFSAIFEVAACLIISFAARGLGSIYRNGAPIFCFSAIAQSSIVVILPGYTVLCAALELQSRNLLAGSVRMVYAIIYSLYLAFGMLLGSVLLGSS